MKSIQLNGVLVFHEGGGVYLITSTWPESNAIVADWEFGRVDASRIVSIVCPGLELTVAGYIQLGGPACIGHVSMCGALCETGDDVSCCTLCDVEWCKVIDFQCGRECVLLHATTEIIESVLNEWRESILSEVMLTAGEKERILARTSS